ncbi:MAG: cytochrome c biogenesis protein CcsA [Candidatus Neomarinimicrobiota bacterium]
MIKNIISLLINFRLTIFLLASFAIACAVATFIENDFGTAAAKHLIYNAKWFEMIIFLLALNGIGNIVKYKMYKKGKLPLLIFHLAFIIIIIGSAITRYFSFEGTMHIREGNRSNYIVSGNTYLQFRVHDTKRKIDFEKELFINPLSNKKIDLNFNFSGKDVSFALSDVIINAKDTLITSANGNNYLELVTSGPGGMKSQFLADSSTGSFNGLLISFNANNYNDAIQIKTSDDSLILNSPFAGNYMTMDDRKTGILTSNVDHELKKRHLYNLNGIPIVYKAFHKNKELRKISGPITKERNNDILEITVGVNDHAQQVYLAGGRGYVLPKTEFQLDGLSFSISYGSKYYKTPFYIQLDDFRLKRYPGSMSPSAYESAVTLFDYRKSEEGIEHLIHMNYVLDHDGYRFFQSSYDKDELGSVLSVNHDSWGTRVTYLGYSLLIIGMIFTLLSIKSRFQRLGGKVKKLRLKREAMGALVILGAFSLLTNIAVAQHSSEMIDENIVNVEHANKFERLLIQERSGRIIPLQTLASKILRKVSRLENFKSQNPSQVLLGMMSNTHYWEHELLIKVSHPDLKKKLETNGNYASFLDFFDEKSNYILHSDVSIANRKKPAVRSKYDKDVLAVDERVNICYSVFRGTILKLFPNSIDHNNTWYNSQDYRKFNSANSEFVKSALSQYYRLINESISSNDWSKPDSILNEIAAFQNIHGSAIIPSGSIIGMEIAYNKINIFKRLFVYYLIVGIVLLIVLFVDIFKKIFINNKIIAALSYTLGILFLLHTAGLVVRWYISGHAPWSNAYESMIYIGWATVLAGFLFSKTSKMTLAATSILTSLILMVAHLNWLDPEITPLVPVLKSYWLMIHVAIITGSYGFLGLGALLGFINLILMIFRNNHNKLKIDDTISELTHLNEMTITVGLFLAAIGTFLGGIWANESWGRYWGWDPKETWALIIVLTYAIVLHLRFITKVNSRYIFNLTSVLGFSTVIMTYFGVNYFLSGLHSYAAGDPLPIPNFVYYSIGVISIVAVLAYLNHKKI